MARVIGCVVALGLLLLPHSAAAQKGQQIFDFFLQQADRELQRQQQREVERGQRQYQQQLHQQFIGHWQACHSGDLDACDQALLYPAIGPNDYKAIQVKRAQITVARRDAEARERQERIEAEIAARARKAELERQRQQAAQQQRQPQTGGHIETINVQTATLRERTERPTPTNSEWNAAWFAAALGLGAILLLMVQKAPALRTAFAARFTTRRATPADQSASPKQGPTSAPHAEPPPTTAAQASPPPRPVHERDTPGAIAALELAFAYLEEVRASPIPRFDNPQLANERLNTLALVSRQLHIAASLDPDAVLENEGSEHPCRLSLNELKSEALLLEGITHQPFDLRRALPALVGASTLNPENASAFYVLGLVHAANMNKDAAVAALQRAVALDPKNFSYRKELDRAQNITPAEIAAYKATRAGERIYDAGIATANAGIFAWNIFAITWNIVTFPLRMTFKLFHFFGAFR